MTRDRTTITVSESMEVACPPEDVFDYTQDYGRRTKWDRSVTENRILSESPRRIRIEVRGLGRFTVAYQLFRRPERTSAAFVDVESRWISGGGGSWNYERTAEGTRWTQTNTLELKRPRLLRFLATLIERNLRTAMRRSMAEARRILEA
jgi:Polyketide cyclase / dehydrase and lipid transport